MEPVGAVGDVGAVRAVGPVQHCWQRELWEMWGQRGETNSQRFRGSLLRQARFVCRKDCNSQTSHGDCEACGVKLLTRG